MRFVSVGSIVAAYWLCACHAHQELVAPDSAASVAEREAAYGDLRPLSYHETHITYTRGFVPVGTEKQVDYLQLADGRRVYYPEDILPVVPEGSPAAEAADSSHSSRTTGVTLQALGFTGMFAGLAISTVPLLLRDPEEDLNLTPVYGGLAVVGLGTILYFVGRSIYGTSHDEAATAFETYDSGLRQRLGCSGPGPGCFSHARGTAEKPQAQKSAFASAARPSERVEPEGVGGFRFGADLDQVRQACESAGHQFETSEGTATCSGTAASLGVPARASMTFCSDALCEIEVALEPEAEKYGSVLANLRRQLKGRYGAPAQASVQSKTCRGGLPSCVIDVWRWPSRHSVMITLGITSEKRSFLLTYSSPERTNAPAPGPAL